MATLYACGDSNTAGVNSYVNALAANLGLDLVNNGTGSDMAADQSIKSQSLILGANDIGTLMIGTNDHKRYKNDRLKGNHYRAFVRRIIGNYVHPERTGARTASKTGSWSNSATATGIYSVVSGSKVSATVSGRYVSVGYIIQNADVTVGSIGKVYIDGDYVGSFSSNGYSSPMSTINGADWGCGLVSFDSGFNGSKLVEVVQSSSGCRLYVDDIRGSSQPHSVKVAVGNVLKMGPSGYTQYATNGLNVNLLNGILADIVDEYQRMCFDVTMVDVYSAVKPSTDMYDDVHLSADVGHPKVEALFEAALTA